MKALITILIVVGVAFGAYKIWEYWDNVEHEREMKANAPQAEMTGDRLPGLPQKMDQGLKDAEKGGAKTLKTWLDNRQPLGDVYLGRNYSDAIDRTLEKTPGVIRTGDAAVDGAVRRLAAGEIGAVYTGRMEYGPRALGARSILANPSRRDTHDQLNQRLDRSEFMPFAPVVRDERAAEVFDVTPVNARACRYMTIACGVRPEWQGRIPAVVHVDGSARPQIIARADNPTYYDVLAAFERATGLPVLVNTSFNVHEEPIVNAPAECVQALRDGRIDFVVTDHALYTRAP